jgi:GNAT superfamily N-acetyltransferase
MTVQIVAADLENSGHAQGIVDLLASYAGESGGGNQPLAPEVRERLIPELRKQPNAAIFLALDGDMPVGIALCFVGFSSFHARPLLNLHDFAVLPEHQGRGVGTALLAFIEDHARKLDCCRLTLEVIEQNHDARALYKRVGFGSPGSSEGQHDSLFLTKNL